MIYLISDLHGGEKTDALEKYLSVCMPADTLLILGDIGINWGHDEGMKSFTEYFLNLKANIAFIEGNHENHEYLNSFPEEKRFGDTVNVLTENIVHLKRGGIFTIEGKTFFVMGGCESSTKWKEMGIWYPGEDPSPEEISAAKEKLRSAGYQVDYILTHKYVNKSHREKEVYTSDTLCGLMDFIEDNVTYRHWYAGHWHIDKEVDEKHTFVYNLRLLD